MSKSLLNAISFRISLISSFFTIIILIIMGIVIDQLVIHHFEMQDRSQLEGKAELIQNLLQQHPENSQTLHMYLEDALVGHHNLFVQIERPTGHIIFSSTSSNIERPVLKPSQNSEWVEWQIQDRTYRGLVFITDQIQIKDASHQPVHVIVGIDTSEHLHFLNNFKKQLIIIGLIGTVCLMILGWVAAWRGLRPVQKMTSVAEGISVQNLSERLELYKTPTELRSLAVAFNDMLDRLESALEKLSDFSSDLAHEIRTPLNNLMTQTQVCLSRSRDIEAYKEVLFSNLEEFEHLAKMVSDMLFLAKAENGLYLPNLQRVNLVKEIEALFDFYDAFAAERRMTLHQTGSGSVMGDPLMLRRAIGNLLSNAINYGKTDSIIEIKCQQKGNKTIILVENKSVPYTQEQLSRLFDRFYRTDASRQKTEEGTGLGLAITKSILDAHGATIKAEFIQDRMIFTIVFQN